MRFRSRATVVAVSALVAAVALIGGFLVGAGLLGGPDSDADVDASGSVPTTFPAPVTSPPPSGTDPESESAPTTKVAPSTSTTVPSPGPGPAPVLHDEVDCDLPARRGKFDLTGSTQPGHVTSVKTFGDHRCAGVTLTFRAAAPEATVRRHNGRTVTSVSWKTTEFPTGRIDDLVDFAGIDPRITVAVVAHDRSGSRADLFLYHPAAEAADLGVIVVSDGDQLAVAVRPATATDPVPEDDFSTPSTDRPHARGDLERGLLLTRVVDSVNLDGETNLVDISGFARGPGAEVAVAIIDPETGESACAETRKSNAADTQLIGRFGGYTCTSVPPGTYDLTISVDDPDGGPAPLSYTETLVLGAN